MGKSKTKIQYNKTEKDKQISVLKEKNENRKAQVKRLKSYIRELEKKLEDAGKPVVESKVDKPKKPEKVSDASKNLSPEDKKIFAREELKRKLKEKYGRKNIDG